MFPSPQVGSGRIIGQPSDAQLTVFPSPQVGSGPVTMEAALNLKKVSIPSSRVGTTLLGSPFLRMGAFPSPQVGSGLECAHGSRSGSGGFHPLKSGRDILSCHVHAGRGLMFPSPQVGSGPHCPLWLVLAPPKFPSPQVGSGQLLDKQALTWQRGFHPLKSGRDSRQLQPASGYGSCFHPLKSGRDRSAGASAN